MNQIGKTKSPGLVWLIIFIAGFVSLSVEVLTIRQLAAFVGTNVITTSLIIGIFLLFLAVGYWRGGLRQENFYRILYCNFIWSAGLIGIGLAYLFILYSFTFLTYLTSNVLFALTIYLLCIIAPLAYFLGQTIPIAMSIIADGEVIGYVGGKTLFWSTIGSFFGSICTSLLLFEYVGVAWAIVVNFLLLMFLVTILATKTYVKFWYLIVGAFFIAFVYKINVGFEHFYFITTNNYGNYHIQNNLILNDKEGKLLQINNSESSYIDKNNRGFPYIELIKKILFADLNLRHKKILILGAGGFTLTAAGTNDNDVTYVDIDPKIAKIIAEQSYARNDNVHFIANDARVFLNKLKAIDQKYDVVVSDVYSNYRAIPVTLLTVEHLNNVKAVLTANGFAVFNIIARPFFDDNYSKHIDTTLHYVFGNCVSVPLEYSQKTTNIIYVCKQSTNNKSIKFYSDNLNSADLDNAGEQ